MRYPRILAWSIVRTLARRSSRISSSKPSKPALKNTYGQESGVTSRRTEGSGVTQPARETCTTHGTGNELCPEHSMLPSRDKMMWWVGRGQAAVTCSELFLLFPACIFLCPPACLQGSHRPCRVQGCAQAETGIESNRRGNFSLPRISCPLSPWCDQTCTEHGPVPGSSAVSL